MRKYESSFRIINEEELEKMKKILKIKQENLSMLDIDIKNTNEVDGYSYKASAKK